MKPKTILLPLLFIFLIALESMRGAAQGTPPAKGGAPQLGPESKIVDKWRGTWDVKATRRNPQPTTVITYVETFEWILDGRFLRSETSRKSDGGKSSSMVWYDINTKAYRYLIFDAAGFAFELPPPTWNEGTQTMQWDSGYFSPASYKAHATFSDRDTILWKSLLKDWKGTVVLELEGKSVRRK